MASVPAASLAKRMVLGLGLGSAVACSRPSVASWLPALELGVSVRRHADQRSGAQLETAQRWDTLALVSLRFRALNPAAELPVRGELAPETWLAPCDSDDEICLQEAADAEREIGAAFGELQ